MQVSERHNQVVQTRRGLGWVPRHLSFRSVQGCGSRPSYFQSKNGRVLLCTVNVSIAWITGHYRAWHDNLDRPSKWIVDHLNGITSYTVKRGDSFCRDHL